MELQVVLAFFAGAAFVMFMQISFERKNLFYRTVAGYLDASERFSKKFVRPILPTATMRLTARAVLGLAAIGLLYYFTEM